jgi:hypothetical protein
MRCSASETFEMFVMPKHDRASSWSGCRLGRMTVKSPGLGEPLLSSVTSTFKSIEEFPEMFAVVHGSIRRATVSRFPFSVFYGRTIRMAD